MKRILVTGSNGQLGSELKFLADSYVDFGFTFLVRTDLAITDRQQVSAYFDANKFDYVINCAAYTAVDKAEADTEQAYLVNEKAVFNLAEACKKHDCKMIHISTDFVFDGTSSIPLKEDFKTNPLSVYGASKLAGEKAAPAVNDELLIIRTSWVYSTFGNNFAKTILRLCNERDELNVIFDQVGTPTYARDLAKTLLSIIRADKWHSGIFNYSNEGVASWYDFAVAIRDIANFKTKIFPIETTEYPTPALRPKYSVLNKKKIKQTFHLEIPYWRTSLQSCILDLIR